MPNRIAPTPLLDNAHEVVLPPNLELASKDLKEALALKVYTSRGVTMRHPTTGGVPERGLAERYMTLAAMVNDLWPRTAAMLNGIAEMYRANATREDVSATLTEDFCR